MSIATSDLLAKGYVLVAGEWVKPRLSHASRPFDALKPLPTEVAAKPRVQCEARPSTDEDKLNKTERAYLAILRVTPGVEWIGIQNFTLKFGADLRFTPDFTHIKDGKIFMTDTKRKAGMTWEDSRVKIKACARAFPWAYFVIANRTPEGVFEIEEIKP